MLINNNHASFHLWQKKNLVKHQKVTKYYKNGSRLSQIIERSNNEKGFGSSRIICEVSLVVKERLLLSPEKQSVRRREPNIF